MVRLHHLSSPCGHAHSARTEHDSLLCWLLRRPSFIGEMYYASRSMNAGNMRNTNPLTHPSTYFHHHHKEIKSNSPLLHKFEKSTEATSQKKKTECHTHVTANTMRLQRIFYMVCSATFMRSTHPSLHQPSLHPTTAWSVSNTCHGQILCSSETRSHVTILIINLALCCPRCAQFLGTPLLVSCSSCTTPSSLLKLFTLPLELITLRTD
jgi:hypothetical protein